MKAAKNPSVAACKRWPTSASERTPGARVMQTPRHAHCTPSSARGSAWPFNTFGGVGAGEVATLVEFQGPMGCAGDLERVATGPARVPAHERVFVKFESKRVDGPLARVACRFGAEHGRGRTAAGRRCEPRNGGQSRGRRGIKYEN